MVSAKRYAAVGALLVAGLLLSQSFAAAASLQTTAEATRVDPALVPHEVAAADHEVVDLDRWMRSQPDASDAVLREAVQSGSFSGSVPPELYMRVEDLSNETRFAVYEGSYYRFDVTRSDDETTNATIRTAPANAETVAEAVATDYENASADVRAVVDAGEVTTDSFVVRRGLYERDGDYYLVRPANEGAFAGKFFAAVGGFLFDPIGKAYAVAGLGLLAAIRIRRVPRPLTSRGALAVLPGTLAFAWAGALVTSGAPAMRFVLVPAIGVVAAFGLFAGLCLRRRAWAPLTLGSLGLVGGVVAAGVATMGVLGGAFGTLGVVAGWTGSLPLAGYGYAFAADRANGGGDEDGPGDSTSDEPARGPHAERE